MPPAPLVSCIMPTRDRRPFVAQAIAYFQRQEYEPRELLVVDDGEDPIDDLVPDDSRIRYIRLDRSGTLGAKRNFACELSRGELICHWDDDDWIAPHRIGLQVERLHVSGADVCGQVELLHYRPKAGEAWLYRGLASDRPWLAGGTLLYRRSAWEASPFPDVHVGEDAGFVWQLSPERIDAMSDDGFYVALLHERNTAAKNLDDGRWQRVRLDGVSRLLAPDRDFYAGLRAGRAAPAPPIRKTPAAVSVVAPFTVCDGYGSMAEYLVLGMLRAGATVSPMPLVVDRPGLSKELLAVLDDAGPAPGTPVLFFSWPSAALRRFEAEPELFINTMWESSRLPAGWRAALDRARTVIVPTHFVARVCRDSGVTAPIEVVPEGVDPCVYHFKRRPEREGLTTLIVAPVVARKHVLEGIAGWKRAFAGDRSARLIIKARFGYGNYHPDDSRIHLVDGDEKRRGIAHWYREADVLLALGNEGFGLPLIEGMATGLPVVALDSEGQSDACDEARDLVLPVSPAGWQPCDDPPFGPAGIRGVPDPADIARQLRWVADHRDEARELGCAASAWALSRRNVWDKGPAVLAVMEQRVVPPRPLRRERVTWAPSLHMPCGIAEYVRDLIGAGAPATASASMPDLRGVRLLHIQHEPSLIHDSDVHRVTQEAREQRIAVVVTEHAVTASPPAWEDQVSALVAPSRAGADLLRRRCPGQRVEHIPLGCPTWFPPRKPTRGRVIGAFGFLEPHKGFGRVLELVRKLGNVRLLICSHSKREAAVWEFAAAIDGLPVRWLRDFRRADEVARLLAADADILVYWYDESPVLSASAAVRVGLATGVPVLTSPTAWFSDLRDVTYQPATLEDGVSRLLDDTSLRNTLIGAARDYCHEHRWRVVARRHEDLWSSIDRRPSPVTLV